MTQKSKTQRERRRRRWYDEERPTLLVRLRLVASAYHVDTYKDTPVRDADRLRWFVSLMEKKSLNHSKEL